MMQLEYQHVHLMMTHTTDTVQILTQNKQHEERMQLWSQHLPAHAARGLNSRKTFTICNRSIYIMGLTDTPVTCPRLNRALIKQWTVSQLPSCQIYISVLSGHNQYHNIYLRSVRRTSVHA